jgi:hypothetical protein
MTASMQTSNALQREGRQLTELLTQQRDLYQQLRLLAESQSAAISDDQPEALLRILSQRQRLIHELTQVNVLLEPYRSRWDHIREGLDPAQRLRVGELVEEVQDLLSQILKQDQGDCDMLEQRTGEVRNEAVSASLGRKVNAAYAMQSYSAAAARYVDRSDGEASQA